MMPVKGSKITTKYKATGSMWAGGIHKGVDIKGSKGTKVYAPWGGKVIGIGTWGPAFGSRSPVIDFDKLPNGDPGYWGVIAHLDTCAVKVGQRVKAGDYIGTVGDRGNATGPHVHFEVQTGSNWSANNHVDPAPWIAAGETTSTKKIKIYSEKLGAGEPSNGDSFSDTVKALQKELNGIKLKGGQTLKITGVYDADTDEEVRLWQEQICKDKPDPVGKSFLGKKQRERMFSSSKYQIIDNGLPKVASSSGGSSSGGSSSGTTLGKYLKDMGFNVDDKNVPFGRKTTWRKVEFIVIHHTGSPDTNTPESDVKWIKSGNEDAPLAHLYMDYSGKVWVCCQQRSGQAEPGRASHAGLGSGFGVAENKLNENSIGIEFKGDGNTPLSAYKKMYSEAIKLIARLCERYKVPVENVIGHKEWSDRKKDPLDDMAVIREAVSEELWSGSVPNPEPNPEPSSNIGLWDDYSGKPSGTLKIKAGSWVKLDVKVAATPYSGHETHKMYARVNFIWKKGGSKDAKLECKYARDSADPDGETAFDERHYEYGTKSVPFQMLHVEIGKKNIGGQWYLKVHGDVESIEVTTRYCSTYVIYVK